MQNTQVSFYFKAANPETSSPGDLSNYHLSFVQLICCTDGYKETLRYTTID